MRDGGARLPDEETEEPVATSRVWRGRYSSGDRDRGLTPFQRGRAGGRLGHTSRAGCPSRPTNRFHSSSDDCLDAFRRRTHGEKSDVQRLAVRNHISDTDRRGSTGTTGGVLLMFVKYCVGAVDAVGRRMLAG